MSSEMTQPPSSRTPPPKRAEESTSKSTPVRHADPPYAEHVRQEMQDFANYPPPKELVGDASAKFRDLCDKLALGSETAPEPPANDRSFASWAKFTKDINKVCRNIQPEGSPLLVFKDSEHNRPHMHHCDTQARPDIVAAFDGHWYARDDPNGSNAGAGAKRKHVLWSCVRLAGEKASKGESKEMQAKHTLTYLDLLLLARPDFRGAFGLWLTPGEMILFVAVGGSKDLYKYAFKWGDRYTRRAAYVLVYRLYDPGRWRNPHIVMDYDHDDGPRAKFSISFPKAEEREAPGETSDSNAMAVQWKPSATDGIADDEPLQQARERTWVADYVCVFGSATFRTRTHVFVHCPSESSNTEDQGSRKIPKVLKAQLCPTNARSNEEATLKHIHSLQPFPGVVNLASHESTDAIVDGKVQKYLGLEPQGNPFMSIETPQEMLMVIYDILEITRALYNERKVLHRDLSKGNILFVPTPSTALPTATSLGNTGEANDSLTVAVDGDVGLRKYSYIASLLGKSPDPAQTWALLIDFNYSEDREGEARTAAHRLDRTGTPMFMARAIQEGTPIPLEEETILPNMPKAPQPYADRFPERCQQFLDCQATGSIDILRRDDPHCSPDTFTLPHFRHELCHDAESIFWVMFYWILLAKPASGNTAVNDRIPFTMWAELLTSDGKDKILRGAYKFPTKSLHPSYSGLSTLIARLSKYLKVDPYWFDPKSSRSDPEFVHECFQREILNFLMEHIDEPFMTCKKSKTTRAVREESTTPSLSTPSIASQVAVPNPNPNPYPPTTGVTTLVNPSSHPTTFVLGPRARSSSTHIQDTRSSKRGRFDQKHAYSSELGAEGS